jgi:hypothetical protein
MADTPSIATSDVSIPFSVVVTVPSSYDFGHANALLRRTPTILTRTAAVLESSCFLREAAHGLIQETPRL